MSIFTNLEKVEENLEADFDTFWNTKIKPFLTSEVEPALKKFMSQFDSVFGAQAITAALGAVASLEGGAAFGATAVGLATTLYADAKTDAASTAELNATEILQIVQSALQVAKSSNNVVTPADVTAAAAIAA